MFDIWNRITRKTRPLMAVGALSLFSAGPMIEQCAPPPPPDWSGIGGCFIDMNPNRISGYAGCSSAQANGRTQVRSACNYTVRRPDFSFNMTTLGPLVNPPNADPAYPGLSVVLSHCPVPSMTYQPYGSYPVLNSIDIELY